MPKNTKLRVVLDTNVIISGLIFPASIPGTVLTYVAKSCCLLQSNETLEELAQVLQRAKFDRWIEREARVAAFVGLGRISVHIATVPLFDSCRDPKDNKYLDLACAGRAICIVTGDEDLLCLRQIQQTEILTPNLFLSKHTDSV